MKTSLKNIGLTIILFCFCFTAFAQSKDKHTKKHSTTYVKIEIAGHGLHCPFLGMSLKDKIKNTQEFSDFYIDKDDEYLAFNFPSEMNLTKEELFKIPVEIGYPAGIVNVIIADKPFKIKNKRSNHKINRSEYAEQKKHKQMQKKYDEGSNI
ncbi:MAG: hypothetical protein FVQ77_17390 [Cytophagales bacterium]|nr:hypothetical protein [Cytophagales bacterium]